MKKKTCNGGKVVFQPRSCDFLCWIHLVFDSLRVRERARKSSAESFPFWIFYRSPCASAPFIFTPSSKRYGLQVWANDLISLLKIVCLESLQLFHKFLPPSTALGSVEALHQALGMDSQTQTLSSSYWFLADLINLVSDFRLLCFFEVQLIIFTSWKWMTELKRNSTKIFEHYS